MINIIVKVLMHIQLYNFPFFFKSHFLLKIFSVRFIKKNDIKNVDILQMVHSFKMNKYIKSDESIMNKSDKISDMKKSIQMWNWRSMLYIQSEKKNKINQAFSYNLIGCYYIFLKNYLLNF